MCILADFLEPVESREMRVKVLYIHQNLRDVIELQQWKIQRSYIRQKLVHAHIFDFPKLVGHGRWEDGAIAGINNEAQGLVVFREPSFDPARTIRIEVLPSPHGRQLPPFFGIIDLQFGLAPPQTVGDETKKHCDRHKGLRGRYPLVRFDGQKNLAEHCVRQIGPMHTSGKEERAKNESAATVYNRITALMLLGFCGREHSSSQQIGRAHV